MFWSKANQWEIVPRPSLWRQSVPRSPKAVFPASHSLFYWARIDRATSVKGGQGTNEWVVMLPILVVQVGQGEIHTWKSRQNKNTELLRLLIYISTRHSHLYPANCPRRKPDMYTICTPSAWALFSSAWSWRMDLQAKRSLPAVRTTSPSANSRLYRPSAVLSDQPREKLPPGQWWHGAPPS